MSYSHDYVHYGSGHDCPIAYMRWGARSLITHLAGRKVWVNHGSYFTIYPNLYVVNIGDAGSGKSTAMDQNELIMRSCFPDYVQAASVQSAQHILKVLCSDQCERSWKDTKNHCGTPGKIWTWKPFYCLVDEMTNFVSVDKDDMVGLLVGIYSRAHFSTGYKNEDREGRSQAIVHPFFSLMGCAIPEWVMFNLKIELFAGGLGRRLVIVNAKKERETANPTHPPGAKEAMERIISHLRQIENPEFNGPFKRTPDADRWWLSWFEDPKRRLVDDPILRQFKATEHIQLLKVALAEALSRPDFHTMEIRAEDLEGAKNALNALYPDVMRLTSGVGNNQLAGVGQALLEHIRVLGGLAPEKTLFKAYHRHLRTPEFQELMNDYVKMGKLYVVAGFGATGNDRMWILEEHYKLIEELQKQKGVTLHDAIKAYHLAANGGLGGMGPTPLPSLTP